MSNKIILPKGHLSWSQITVWTSNKDRYRREYFEKGDKFDTKYLRFGKGFATLIEDLEEAENRLGAKDKAITELVAKYGLSYEMKQVLTDLDTDGKSEYKIEGEICGVPMLCYLDKYKEKENTIGEYKTGKIPWSKAKVQKHDQLLLYALAVKNKTGVMPPSCTLHWIETCDTPKEEVKVTPFWRERVGDIIHVTGRTRPFEREFDEREIDRMEQLIIRNATEISNAYRRFLEEI